MQLLEPEKYPFLYKCLYGLLMLMPQSSAFAALKNRLNSVSAIGYLHQLTPRGYVFCIMLPQPIVLLIYSIAKPLTHLMNLETVSKREVRTTSSGLSYWTNSNTYKKRL